MNNTRETLQKKIIFDCLKNNKVHPTAEDVYNIVHKDYPNISKATVYRVLSKLSENGQIRKLDFDTSSRFDDEIAPHYHFVCKRCNKIIDFFLNEERLTQLDEFKQTFNDFSIDDTEIVFKGLCKDCQKKEN